MAPTVKASNLFSYQDQVLGQRALVAVAADSSGFQSISNTILYWESNGSPTTIFTPSVGAHDVRMVCSRDYAFFTDSVSADLKQWHIVNGLANWGIAAPLSSLTISSVASAGNVTLLIGRVYSIAYYNNTTQSYSDLSPFSGSTGAITSKEISLTSIPVSSDPQVDHKILLATADGGDETTLYEVTTLSNATTTYTDNTPETTLLAANVWQETDTSGIDHGLFGNIPPPNGSFPIAHNGRIFMSIGEVLYFSKSLAEVTTSSGIIAGRYECCWPPVNAINVSTQAEEIRGILSDGQTLYMGTEQHIFRLLGDSPQNFSEPQIVFPQTGLLNQNVWQLVYLEGTPVGTMWLTPDLRIMSSDFNTYTDVGTPVQDILATINRTSLPAISSTVANEASWAVMLSNGPYNIYVLAIPTGSNTVADTFLVYDMRLRKWYVWNFADNFSTGIFYVNLSGIERWIFVDSFGNVRLIDPTTVVDRSGDLSNGNVSITSTLRTSWLDMGDDRLRKTLNEVEVITVDPNLAVTVEGASTTGEFATPNTVITSATPTTNFAGDYKVFLAGLKNLDRNYRFTFVSNSSTSSSTSDVILAAYSVEAVPMHRY